MSSLRGIYRGMKARCYEPSCKSYKYYGGKGIKICNEWLNDYHAFEKWALENGYNSSLSIDRIDNNLWYCPENCRFVTIKEQANNTSRNHLITYNGKTQSLAKWCDELGLCYNKVKIRINRRKWSVEKAFETNGNASLKMITYNNKTQSISSWCKELGINYTKTRTRLSRGWSVERAFTTK